VLDIAPRIAIYGTGQFGQMLTRLAVERGWQVVAAYTRAGPKIGQDVGSLAGLGRDLGVIVQDCEAADYSAAGANIGVVTLSNQLAVNLPAYRRLIGAGLNVLCHGTEAYFPRGNNPALADEIDVLAKGMGVTFSGTGIWDMSRIWAGISLAAPCTRIDSLFHRSITDCSRVGKEAMLFTGVGSRPEDFASLPARLAVLRSYKTIPEQVLFGLGYSISDTDVHVEPVVFDRAIACPLLERDIPRGECVGTRIVATANTAEGVTARAEMELRLFWPDEVEHMFWEVDGKPISRVRTERENSDHATAA
jgi:4-hydroxy-tetrahydrodipicolinate reductase